jgi:hypothetical protein
VFPEGFMRKVSWIHLRSGHFRWWRRMGCCGVIQVTGNACAYQENEAVRCCRSYFGGSGRGRAKWRARYWIFRSTRTQLPATPRGGRPGPRAASAPAYTASLPRRPLSRTLLKRQRGACGCTWQWNWQSASCSGCRGISGTTCTRRQARHQPAQACRSRTSSSIRPRSESQANMKRAAPPMKV